MRIVALFALVAVLVWLSFVGMASPAHAQGPTPTPSGPSPLLPLGPPARIDGPSAAAPPQTLHQVVCRAAWPSVPSGRRAVFPGAFPGRVPVAGITRVTGGRTLTRSICATRCGITLPLVKARSFCQLHNSLGGGNAPQGGMEVVLIPLLETAPTPDPALDPDVALDPDLALDPENAVLDP